MERKILEWLGDVDDRYLEASEKARVSARSTGKMRGPGSRVRIFLTAAAVLVLIMAGIAGSRGMRTPVTIHPGGQGEEPKTPESGEESQKLPVLAPEETWRINAVKDGVEDFCRLKGIEDTEPVWQITPDYFGENPAAEIFTDFDTVWLQVPGEKVQTLVLLEHLAGSGLRMGNMALADLDENGSYELYWIHDDRILLGEWCSICFCPLDALYTPQTQLPCWYAGPADSSEWNALTPMLSLDENGELALYSAEESGEDTELTLARKELLTGNYGQKTIRGNMAWANALLNITDYSSSDVLGDISLPFRGNSSVYSPMWGMSYEEFIGTGYGEPDELEYPEAGELVCRYRNSVIGGKILDKLEFVFDISGEVTQLREFRIILPEKRYNSGNPSLRQAVEVLAAAMVSEELEGMTAENPAGGENEYGTIYDGRRFSGGVPGNLTGELKQLCEEITEDSPERETWLQEPLTVFEEAFSENAEGVKTVCFRVKASPLMESLSLAYHAKREEEVKALLQSWCSGLSKQDPELLRLSRADYHSVGAWPEVTEPADRDRILGELLSLLQSDGNRLVLYDPNTNSILNNPAVFLSDSIDSVTVGSTLKVGENASFELTVKDNGYSVLKIEILKEGRCMRALLLPENYEGMKRLWYDLVKDLDIPAGGGMRHFFEAIGAELD